jgi:hypothetical protein
MIIDTFLFSEPYENDLLYLKLILENDGVDLWIIQENSYTTQGEYKGVHAKSVLAEERFKPYLHKIMVVSADEKGKNSNDEGSNFERENWQRTLCLQALSKFASSNDSIIVSDTDESIDFSDSNRKNRFYELIEKHQSVPIWVGRMRYWYDFDNRCYIHGLRIPVVPYSLLLQQPASIMRVRHQAFGPAYDANEDPIAFEYSYVFKNIDDIWRKKTTFAHNNYTYDCIVEGLKYNHFPASPLRGDAKPGTHEHDWLEEVVLTTKNSPQYVRDNLDTLKTNLVDPNYKYNRKEKYGYST